jgi:hypothetical protein
MAGINNIRKNPGQMKEAMKRMFQVSEGSPLSEKETVPARAGQAAGMVGEMMMPMMDTSGMKAGNPFTAGIKSPSTALPGAFDKAGQELGQAKGLARTGEDFKESMRLRGMLRTPTGAGKLADEAMQVLKSGKDVSVTHLMAYRDALGKMMNEGGTFSNDYKIAKDMASEMLKKKSPDLMKKMETMATNFTARGNPKTRFPWVTTAINPEVGLAKAATMPSVQNAAGAAVSPLAHAPAQVSSLVNQLLKLIRDKYENPNSQR